MKIKKIKIHNFRSIKDQEIILDDYSILLGENNAGKTNVIRALRIFYENNLKFDSKVDFPKFKTDDQESWIEIDFLTTTEEQSSLKDEYKSSDNILKVRKFLKSNNKERVKNNQSNIFGYENGFLSENLFYGFKNIAESKIGNLIYIPELSKIDDSLKMSGPSPLRDMINFVITKIAKKSASFLKLEEDFQNFNSIFKTEDTDGFSVSNLEKDINDEIKEWNIQFGLRVNPLQPNDIVKNLVSHFIKDGFLNNEEVKIDSFGQGLQRHLIYALIKLSTKYNEQTKREKKEFAPDFTFILFEEPEAFLHPSQQEKMNTSLQLLAKSEDQQILITTHSPIFVSKNTANISSLIRVKRDGESKIFQIHREQVKNLFDQNTGMHQMFLEKLKNPSVDEQIKKKIRDKKLAGETDDLEIKLREESFKYFLWIDAERASSFFAKHVLICEGATEKIFLDYLTDTIWTEFKEKHIYILDALGKFNIHRYMNLFGFLGIEHSVLMDKDNDKDVHKEINTFIESNRNIYTRQIQCFDKDIETFLGIEPPVRGDQKPLNIIYRYNQKEITKDRIDALKILFKDTLNIPTHMQKVETVAIVNAEISKVWEHYNNPESIKGWAFASDDWECPHAENDLRVDGRFLTRMQAKDGSFGFDLTGTYREVVNLEKIVYIMDKAPEEEVGRECIVTFEDLGDNTTKVIVAFDPENSNPIEMQREGWQSILNNFKKFVENN